MRDDKYCKISIIVPVYNEENFILNCCNSILNSTISDFEIVIIDDNSTDDTYSICVKLAKTDSRIRLYRNSDQKGPAAARNIGLDVARGKYITFVDADDTIHQDCLKDFVSCFERYGVDLVMADAIRVDSLGRVHENYWKQEALYLEKKDVIQSVVEFLENERGNRIFCSVWGKAFRHDFIDQYKLRFDETLRTYEDELFCFSYLSKINCCYYINQGYYTYYRNRNNIGSSSVITNPLAFKKTLLVIKRFLEEYISPDELYKLYGNAYCEYTVSACYHFVRLSKVSCYAEWRETIRGLRNILRDREFKNNQSFYHSQNCDNSPAVVYFVKQGWAMLTWFGFKRQIKKQMKKQ